MKYILVILLGFVLFVRCKNREAKIQEAIALHNQNDELLKDYKYGEIIKIDSISDQKELSNVSAFAIALSGTNTQLANISMVNPQAVAAFLKLNPEISTKDDASDTQSYINKAENYAIIAAKLQLASRQANNNNFNYYKISMKFSNNADHTKDTIVDYYVSNAYKIIPWKEITRKYLID